MRKNKNIFVLVTVVLVVLLVSCAGFLKLKVGFSTCIVNVTYTTEYCMGMRPTQEMLDSLAKPRAYVGKKLYLKKGEVNESSAPILQTLITKAGGVISLPDLFPGKYYIVDDEHLHPIDYAHQNDMVVTDQGCIDKWFKKPLLTFEIKKNKKQHIYLAVNFCKSCYKGEANVPCLQYTGPLKP
jgi:hypothetical protein